MTSNEVKHLQKRMNGFVANNKSLGLEKVQVDGDFGRLTKKLVRDIKYALGYLPEKLNSRVDDNFFRRMDYPNKVKKDWGVTPEAIKRGKDRRAKMRREAKRNDDKSKPVAGVGTFDGKPVAKAVIPHLQWARKNGWRGVLVSGYRTPEYSEQLCIRMCGRPSCPGRCAGRATNHAYAQVNRFGIDVSDYANFGRLMKRCPHKPVIFNVLGARDPVHFSPSGR